jgi:CRISPR system Cascade subunit CasC
MKLEIHLLQNFAPSNLNRDDTGAPKDCEFGGYRRARISSQCQKRAVREAFRLEKLVEPDAQGARTKRLVLAIADVLVTQHGHDQEGARALAMAALEGVGLGRDKKGTGDDAWKTEYLLFVPRRIVADIAAVLHTHREALQPAIEAAPSEAGTAAKGAKKESKKDAKKAAQSAYPKEVKEAIETHLEAARRTVDVSLFGRMIADKPEWNVDAACQVAHALSTNRVQMDFDFFTAVDDFKPKDNAGSDMMGTVQFNSSCFYRYAVVDVDALRANLDGNDALLKQAIDAFVRGFITAIPTGKQNSMAAHNFPSYALAVVRPGGQSLSLANAFLKPARPRGEDIDLVDDSIQKLEQYSANVREVLGDATLLSWADRALTAADDRPSRAASLADFFSTITAKALGAA